MNPRRVEEIRERWAGSLTEMYPSGTEEADYRDVRDLLAEIDELRALVDQLSAELDEYRPEGVTRYRRRTRRDAQRSQVTK